MREPIHFKSQEERLTFLKGGFEEIKPQKVAETAKIEDEKPEIDEKSQKTASKSKKTASKAKNSKKTAKKGEE